MTDPSTVKRYASSILLVVGLAFIAYIGNLYFEDLKFHFSNFLPVLFLLSIAMGVVGNFGFALMFKTLLSKYGLRPESVSAVSVFYASQVAKYIPGKVWAYLFQVAKINVPNSGLIIVSSNIELTIFSLLINSALGFALYFLSSWSLFALIVFSAGVLLSIVLRNFSLIAFIPKRLEKRLGIYGCLPARASVSIVSLIKCWGFSVVYVLAHVFLFQAFFDVSIDDSFKLISFLFLSWVISLFAIIIPAGVGIKEALFFLFASMDGSYADSFLVSVALISRFWQIAVDLAGAMAIAFVSKAEELCCCAKRKV